MFNEYSPQYIALIKANTAFKSDDMAKSVVETLKWLDKGAPEKFADLPGKFKFDMSTFVDTDFDTLGTWSEENRLKTCGTACCIAGAIHCFQEKGDVATIMDECREIDDVFDYSSHPELENLFFVTKTVGMGLESITAKGAAITLRRYIESGEVIWRLEEQE